MSTILRQKPPVPAGENLKVKFLMDLKWTIPYDRIELQGQPRVYLIENRLLYDIDWCHESGFDGRNWLNIQKESKKRKNNPITVRLDNRHQGTWNWYHKIHLKILYKFSINFSEWLLSRNALFKGQKNFFLNFVYWLSRVYRE